MYVYLHDVGHPSALLYSILWNHSCLSIQLFVTKFSQDWITSFFWYFTWWWLTMISSDWRNHIPPPPPQKKRWPKFGPNGPKSGQKLVFFASFLSLDHMFSLKLHTVIAYTEALHLVQVGIPKNSVGPKFGPIRPKSGPKSVFFCHFVKYYSLVFL